MTTVAAPKGRYAYHIPQCKPGEICKCGKPFASHRVEHQPDADPCTKCGLPYEKHYKKFPKKQRDRCYCVGIDGEGQGRDDHRYVMLAFSNASGTIRNSIESAEGKSLTTVECLDFILTLPHNAKVFAFAFQYDVTKILADCDDGTIYRLWRPDLRQRPPDKQHLGPIPVVWNGYILNMLGSKFSVQKGGQRTVIWDCFKFFQSKFTKALEDWKVASSEELAEMRAMKDQRSDFDKLNRGDILRYCFSECSMMAILAKRLIEAHNAAGLTLRSYHGAGSTASCVLKAMQIDKVKRIGPKEMDRAVSSAFFGGRFENRVVGVIKGPLYSRDISSAYPYQTTFLPCLECGAWLLTRKRETLESCTTALVHYRLGKPPSGIVWGPLPFRSKDGSICFPGTSGGGWVWLSEFKAAEAAFPHVQFIEAYVYNTDCQHKPFAQVPRLYLERLRLGKEGPGIVIKLGTNAIYGKLAQSKGTAPPFQSWIWAGMITSGTRAEIIKMMSLHKDPRNLFMIATDGIYTAENFPAPQPRDTGTYTDQHKKPLGGWETKEIKGDMFAARPGIYYPLNPTVEEIAQVRARGVGRSVVLQYWRKIIDAWEHGEKSVTVGNVVRFNGAKSSIGRIPDPEHKGKWVYNRFVDDKTGRPRYGQWCNRQIDMTFHPMPKRHHINPDGSLAMRHMPDDVESEPYKASVLSMDSIALKLNMIEVLEQPDGADYVEYDE
jgi:hypothetical protein